MGDPSRFDFEGVARRINAENRAESERAGIRRAAAIEEGRRIAAALRVRDRDIRKVWGFGSTFEASRPYRTDSDIDLAIEGGDILRLLSVAECSEFRVDLVDITDMDDGFARAIRKYGITL